MKDIIIVGSGPSGMTAALYGGRAQLDTLLVEKSFQGGQMVSTNEVENYPGIVETTGPALSNLMFEHAKKYGAEVAYEEVEKLELEGDVKKVVTDLNTYEAKTIILSMGSTPRNLGLENEEKFTGRGVHYCAICDGGFYKDKVVAVNGGGDTAVEDALYLSRLAKKVYLIHRRDELRANKTLQKRILNSDVEIIWDSTIASINGTDKFESISIKNKNDNSIKELELDALFVAIGSNPTSDLVKGVVETNKAGYIITDEDCKTNIDGVFAAGDIRAKSLRQIITAAADGAIAVHSAEKYIYSQE